MLRAAEIGAVSNASVSVPVSVVIPAFRRAELVARAVRSALSQRPQPDEVIVVDDCSGDGTGSSAHTAGARVITHVRNGGEGAARNTAIDASRNDWVAFLDSDDMWLPGHLENLWAARDGHVLVGAAGRGSLDGRWYGQPRLRPLLLAGPRDVIVPHNCVTPSGAMAKRDSLIAVGGFPARRHVGDLDTWIRLLEHGTGVALGVQGFVYEQHAGQVSVDLEAMSIALMDVIDGYSDRSWWSASLSRQAEAMPMWDQARALQAAGRPTAAAKALGPFIDPRRLLGLNKLLVSRRHAARRRVGSVSIMNGDGT